MVVLVAYDGSRPAQRALQHAAEQYGDEEIVLLRVVEAADGSLEAGLDMLQEKLREIREETATEVSEEVIDLIGDDAYEFRMEMVAGTPSREIVAYAEEHEIDTIVIGNHGRRGPSRILLGSVAERVVRRAPCTVTVVR